jgi:hypothetical protein
MFEGENVILFLLYNHEVLVYHLCIFHILGYSCVGMFYRQRMLVIDGKYNNDDQQRSDNRGRAETMIVGSTIQNSRWLLDLNVDKRSAQICRIDLGC